LLIMSRSVLVFKRGTGVANGVEHALALMAGPAACAMTYRKRVRERSVRFAWVV